MSVFNIIGLSILTTVAIAGVIIKIALIIRRKKLEGCHGYCDRQAPGTNETEWRPTDDWPIL